jgi:hypothetical protein
MTAVRMLVAVCMGAVMLSGAAVARLSAQLGDDPILAVIDLTQVLARQPGSGNAIGLAFDPQRNVLYLGHNPLQGTPGQPNSIPRSFIYTLDLQGNVLDEFDFERAFFERTSQPGAILDGLSHDPIRGHLFALAAVPVNPSNLFAYVPRLVEIDLETFTFLSDRPFGGFGDIRARPDGIWQARFAEDAIRHYSPSLTVIGNVSVASSFPGFPGPYALTSSFRDGFFLVDHFGRRLVEVDAAGREIAVSSTAMLPDGRGMAIDVDPETRRIFLQIGNKAIYVLADTFIGGQPSVLTIDIDIKPGEFPNSINVRSNGVIPVAILTTAAFDAATVDPSTVRFGPNAATDVNRQGQFDDVDGDGDLDLVLHFRTRDTGVVCGIGSIALSGSTYSGEPLTGSDSVRPVLCR